VLMALIAYRRFANPGPEVLVLRPGELQHVEAPLPAGRQRDTGGDSVSLWPWAAMLLRPQRRRKTTLLREEIEEVRLSGGESGCRVLTVRSRGKRLVVGGCLGDPDRRWLADVLRKWLAG